MTWTKRCGVFAIACSGVVGACGGGTDGAGADASSPGDDAGGSGDDQRSPSDATPPGAGCTTVDAGPFGEVSSASGTVTGAGVSATVCNATAYVFESSHTAPANDYLLSLNSAAAATVAFQGPAGASDGLLIGSLMIGAPAPGVYSSAGACGFLDFSYALPVPAGVDCGDATQTGPSCPTGCSTVCSGQGCEPCTPSQPEVDFETLGVSDCLGNATTVTGSWTVTLTSVEPYADSGTDGPHFSVHGTVTATLPANAGGTGSVTLSMTF